MTCTHRQPGLCGLFGFHVVGNMWALWVAPTETGEKYRRDWCETAGVDLEETRSKYGGGSVGGPAYTTDCIHRGVKTIRKQECKSCGGGWLAPVKLCAVHGECTLFSKPVNGVVHCPCPDQDTGVSSVQNVLRHPPTESNTGNHTWAVGITTAPRRTSTLVRCLQSTMDAGFSNLDVFAEPGVARVRGVRWHQRDKRLGVHHNYVEGLKDLLRLHPDATTILMIQDDVVFGKELREFLERDLWPAWNTGVVSLYCPNSKGYEKDTKKIGCKRINHANLIGACAMVFPRAVAHEIAYSNLAEHWSGRVKGRAKNRADRRAVDAFIGTAVRNAGKVSFFYNPSLCQHISKTSTIGHGGNKGFRRSAKFKGEQSIAGDGLPRHWVRYDLPSMDQRFIRPASKAIGDVAVVIPAKDCVDLTTKCLTHIESHTTANVDVVYVDNGSSDESIDQLNELFANTSLNVSTIWNEGNTGFSAACNAGIEAAAGKHILLLNNDAFVGPGCIDNLLKHLEWHPNVGAVCPLTGDQGIQSVKNRDLRRFLGPLPDDLRDPVRCTEVLSREFVAERQLLAFSCVLLNRKTIDKVGMLSGDSEFAFMGSDDEWCRRARKSGAKLLVAFDAYAAHMHRESFKRLGIDRDKEQAKAVKALRGIR